MIQQTIVVLPRIELALARPMSDIPNTEGYKLLGVLPNGMALPLTVKKDFNGCHYLTDQRNSHRLPSVFTGWVKDNA